MKSKMIITTFECDDSKITNIANDLIEMQLAKCINLIPGIKSIYFWNNKLQNSRETMMLIKTIEPNVNKILIYLESKHPYQIPEIICSDFEILNDEYKQWFNTNIGNE